MKILHTLDSSIQNYHGISTYIDELIKSSESRADEVMVFCNTPIYKTNLKPLPNNAKVKQFKSLKIPGKPKFIISINTGIAKAIEDFNPDLIWIHTIGTIGTKVANIARGKYNVVYTKHCFDGDLWCLYLNVPKPFQWIFHAFANRFERRIAAACSFIVYHIHDIKKVEHKAYFNKFLSFNPPLQNRFFENRTEKQLNPMKLSFGFCGRCELDKGIEDTYIGLQLFKEKHPEIDITFYLIGDGPVAQTLPSKYDCITTIVTGFIGNVIPILDKLDGFILSSKHETISLSSLEAYARGIPVFSLPIGYLNELGDLENFYLFEDNEKLVSQLEQVFLIEKKNRTIPDQSILNKVIISYPELLREVTEKIKEFPINK